MVLKKKKKQSQARLFSPVCQQIIVFHVPSQDCAFVSCFCTVNRPICCSALISSTWCWATTDDAISEAKIVVFFFLFFFLFSLSCVIMFCEHKGTYNSIFPVGPHTKIGHPACRQKRLVPLCWEPAGYKINRVQKIRCFVYRDNESDFICDLLFIMFCLWALEERHPSIRPDELAGNGFDQLLASKYWCMFYHVLFRLLFISDLSFVQLETWEK